MATTWTPIASVVQTTIPNDITGNSLALAPVSGDNTAVSLKLGNGSSTLFAVDASGNLSAAASAIVGNQSVGGNLAVTGNETVGGTLTVTGALKTASLVNTGSGTAAGLFSSIAGSVSAPSISYSAQTDSGLYLATTSTSAAILALAVNAVQSLALSKNGISVPGTLTVSGASTLAGLTATGLTVNGNETVSGTLNVSSATTLAALSATAISAASLSLTGNGTIGGTLGVTGLLTASGNINTPTVVTTQTPTTATVGSTSYNVSNVQLPGSFGDSNTYPKSGISSDSFGNLVFNYQGQPVIKMANPGYNSANGTTPQTAFPTIFSSANYQFNIAGSTQLAMSASAVKFGYTSNTIPVTMQSLSGNILVLQNGGTSPNYTTTTVGTVSSAGLGTFTGLAISSTTGLTFSDNSVQTTAYTSSVANSQAKWIATSNGTTALPAFTFSANTDTGVYLKTSSTSAAVAGLSVNATDALTATSTGIAIPGTLSVSGTLTGGTANLSALTISGTTTAGVVNSGALTSTAAVKATALTISASSGALTFGDGTTQTTAATASAAGSASKFTATANGTVSAPAFTFTNQTDSGLFLATASTSNAVIALGVNGVQQLGISKQVFSVASTLATQIQGTCAVTGAMTTSSTLATGGYIRSIQGSAANPAYQDSSALNTGPYYGGTGTSSTYSISVNGTNATTTNVSGFSVAGNTTCAGTISGYRYAETAGGTASAVAYGDTSYKYGLYFDASSALNVGLSANGTSVLNATASALTLPLPTTHSSTTTLTGATSAAATITSTTATGTPSFVSSQGFRSYFDMGILNYAAGATLPTTATQLMRNGTAYNRSFIPAIATSVMGVSVGLQQTLTTAITITMNVNGTTTTVGTIAAGSTALSAAYAKGTYSLAASNYFYLNASFASATGQSNPVQMDANILIEMGA